MKLIIIGILTFSSLSPILGSNILAFMPSPYGSHIRTYKPLFNELAKRGHNVTFYSGIAFNEKIPNLKEIVIDYNFSSFFDPNVKNAFSQMTGWRHITFLNRMGLFACERLFQHPLIQELIQSTELSFDVILIETFFTHEPFIALGHKFNAPIIHLHPFKDETWVSTMLRNPQPLSYIPNYRLPTTDRLTFYERCHNLLLTSIQVVLGHWHYLPEQEKLMRKYFKYPGSDNLPPLLNQLRNSSLVLLDGSHLITSPSPLLPNFIPVGGIHITNNKLLSPDLEAWMNDSPNGVVYLSLGSMVQVSNMDPKVLNIFLRVLGRLPQKVLWKWEKHTNIPGQPSNVKTSKWFPQQDILAHPKCRAFITHGGFHSVLEAVYFGVPIVGTPVFADQESNIITAERNGIGKMVKFSDFTEELLSAALNKVINDPSFEKNAKRLSNLLKDIPLTPMETAVFWVEHVLRHKGAPHLTPAGLYLPWYKYYMVDVIGAIVLVIVFITLILSKLFNLISRIFCSKKVLNKSKKE